MTHLQLESPIQTRQEVVVDKLREAILRGSFAPGERLDQKEISERLKVSRSPVREALRTLAAEGLVDVIPHRGAVVAELSTDELEEILALRGILEGMAARLAIPKIDEATIKRLESILKKMNRTTNLDDWILLNSQFHQTIYQLTRRRRLLALIENLRNTIAPYMRQYIASSDHIRQVATSHQLIFDACVKRDAARAEKETQKHIAATRAGVVLHAQSLLKMATEETDLVSLAKI